MSEQKPPAEKPALGITLTDGCLGWPVIGGGIVRIDPFHIAAFGLTPAQNPHAASGVEAQGWVVWVDVGTDSPYQVFYQDKRKAVADFIVVQRAKMRH